MTKPQTQTRIQGRNPDSTEPDTRADRPRNLTGDEDGNVFTASGIQSEPIGAAPPTPQNQIHEAGRKAVYVNREVKRRLGSAYSWDGELGELNYIGNPLNYWTTDHENKTLAMIERNWHEATTS